MTRLDEWLTREPAQETFCEGSIENDSDCERIFDDAPDAADWTTENRGSFDVVYCPACQKLREEVEQQILRDEIRKEGSR